MIKLVFPDGEELEVTAQFLKESKALCVMADLTGDIPVTVMGKPVMEMMISFYEAEWNGVGLDWMKAKFVEYKDNLMELFLLLGNYSSLVFTAFDETFATMFAQTFSGESGRSLMGICFECRARVVEEGEGCGASKETWCRYRGGDTTTRWFALQSGPDDEWGYYKQNLHGKRCKHGLWFDNMTRQCLDNFSLGEK